MKFVEALKLSSRFAALGILVGGLLFSGGVGFSQTAPLQVVAAQQAGSPLTIQVTYVDSSDPLHPRYQYSVTNAGDKPVRAYTIKVSATLDAGVPVVSTTLSNLPSAAQALKPYGARQEEGGLGSVYRIPPVRIELSVDFVELADGTRWGEDTAESGDRLDGMRAGGKAAIKMYREILAARGEAGLDDAVSGEESVPREPRPKSDAWARGFEMGVDFVRGRLKRAKERDGRKGVARELDKPFDSSEGRGAL